MPCNASQLTFTRRQRVTPALRDCLKAALTDSITAFADALQVLAEDAALGAALPHAVADADLVPCHARDR